MSKIYLQEKITPVAGKYIIVGNDGNLTTGDLPQTTFPTVIITAPAGTNTVTVTRGNKSLNVTKVNETTFRCNPNEFGVWTVSGVNSGSVLSNTVNVTQINTYTVDISAGGSGDVVDSTLNNNDWNVIRTVAQASEGSSYWSIGDCKSLVLNGTLGSLSFNNETFYVHIIGFDHNSLVEGIGITFQLGKSALTSGVDIGLIDQSYGSSTSSVCFSFNSSNTVAGGWQESRMRNTICNDAFLDCLSSDVLSCVKEIIKYTDNTGTSDSSSNVTTTNDSIFLLAEYEVFGQQDYANSYEQDYQQQYAYYINSNNVRYNYAETNTSIKWLLRSVQYVSAVINPIAQYVVAVSITGEVDNSQPSTSRGFSPAFVIG